jgi:mono/diheme cytochrome c family protein
MPQGSVPVTGVTVAEWEVSYTPSPNAVDSLSRVPNPVAVDERSLANGRRLFQVNCAVCHGDAGDANGGMRQLNPAYGFAPPINGVATVARSDGYLWGMMRNGRGLMSSFNRIPERERWDVVNYVRGLQGRYPVELGPTAFPGEASAFRSVGLPGGAQP